MFDAEKSLQHLKEMRYCVIMMKDGKAVEDIPSLELDEDKENELFLVKNKQKEIDA